MRVFLAFLAITLYFASQTSRAEDVDWKQLNTAGIIDEKSDENIVRNIWREYTQENAIRNLSYYPISLQSPAYRSIVRKILLANSSPLKDDSIESPDLLVKRLEMLLQYGLFEDAESLYQSLPIDARQDEFGLALIGILLTLKNGELAPACLDIQASTTQFRDMPSWRELSHYCQLRFGSSEKATSDDLSFKKFPSFNDMLVNDFKTTDKLASLTEILVAFSDNQISRITYNNTARDINTATDLFVRMALKDSYKQFETYQCYVIEGAARGLLDQNQLADYYKQAVFSEDDLNGHNQAIKMHPCDVPAYFFQRFQNYTPETITAQELNVFLSATQDISVHALAPLAHYLDQAKIDAQYQWDAALIKMAAGIPLDENPMITPLVRIQNANPTKESEANTWLETLKSSYDSASLPFDTALPLYYSRINSGEFSKFNNKRDEFNYENFFSLTYQRKSLNSGLGKIDAMSLALRNDDVVRLFMIALSKAASEKPNTLSPDEIAGILSSLGKYKLEKEKLILAIDALQR